MSKNKKFLLQGVLFCLIFALTFFPIQQVFARKSLEKPWDMSSKVAGFYNEPEDEFTVMYFGSSHAYASFSPISIWEKTGVKSYVFATQMQPIWASVTYLKEALKTQSPELVILECNMLSSNEEYMDEGTNYSYMDDLPLSLNKIELAQASAPEGERFPMVMNFVKYHSRWANLTAEDWTYQPDEMHDPYKGYVMLPQKVGGDRIDRFDLTAVTESLPLTDKNEQYLREFIEICQQEGIDLWLVKAPCNLPPEELSKMFSVQQIAQEYGVPFDDFNSQQVYDEIGLIPDSHFFDQRHMDLVGAEMFCDYFCNLLLQRYPNLSADFEDENWKEDAETYHTEYDMTLENPVPGHTAVAAEDRLKGES